MNYKIWKHVECPFSSRQKYAAKKQAFVILWATKKWGRQQRGSF